MMRRRTLSLAAPRSGAVLLAAGAAAFLWLAPPPATAQAQLEPLTKDEEGAPQSLPHAMAPQDDPVTPGESSTPPTAAEEAADRAQRLDALFAALAESEAGPHEKIEREIMRLLSRSGSDSMDLLVQRGRDAMEEEELTKALHHLTAATDHAPGFAEAWNLRATAFFLRGDLGMALADIEQVLAIEPRHFGALSGLGVILERIGRDEAALNAYREALKVNPNLDRVKEAIERLAPKVDGRDI